MTQASIGPLTGTQSFGAGRPEIRSLAAAGRNVFEERSQYEPGGLLAGLERLDTRASWSFAYDQAGRLEQADRGGMASQEATNWKFDSDSAFNLTRISTVSACGTEVTDLPVDSSGRHRPGLVNGEALQWDARGRLARKRDLALAYDDRDRLIEVTNAVSSEIVASYEYDIFNRRVERTVAGTQRQTVWDGWQAIEEYAQGGLASRRVYGEGLDEILRLEQTLGGGGMTSYFPVYDAIGNVALLVADSGAVVERYEYGPFGARSVTYNDHQGPRVEQVRVQEGALHIQLSEGSVRQAQLASFTLQNLSRSEQPTLRLRQVSSPGRQFGRQLILENGGDPEADPPTWPEPGDHVRFTVAAGTFDDNFENLSEALTLEDAIWPGESGVLADSVPPRIEEICSQGDVLKLTFSEPVSASLASAAIQIDGNSANWQSESGGFVLRTSLSAGSHELITSAAPLDLAGLGLAQTISPTFSVTGATHAIFRLPFPGEAGESTVGNVFGFQGLPEDGETGLLYVRNRYYDPEMGRFITPDPLGYVDGPNVYQFAQNNPVSFGDPLGLSMQASDYAGIAGEGAIATGEQLLHLGDLGLGGKLSALLEGKNAFSEARDADYGIAQSFMYAMGRAKRQASAVQSLGFSEAADPVAHGKALGMGLFNSITGGDQFARGNEAWEHGEKWEAFGRYTAGISTIVSNVAPVAAAKAVRMARATKVAALLSKMEWPAFGHASFDTLAGC